MNIYKSFDLRNNNIDLLAPFVRERARIALTNAQNDGYPVAIFEGYRSPARQETLYSQGRTTAGKIVTRARAWQSTHQYGLAIDIAYLKNNRWSWDGDFDKPSRYFIDQGFSWLAPFEQVHFEITAGLDEKEMYRITQEFGVQTLWELIRTKI